jgi:curved DNA-binding protein CbpA
MSSNSLPDYYEELQVSPNADAETIERVFRLLAKRYHPDNQVTGHAEKFGRISTAFKVLSVDEKRASYDAGYEVMKAKKFKITEPVSPSSSFENDERLRNRILSLLYVERRNDASSSGVGIWRIEQLLGLPEKILGFHVWYMKEKGWIQRTDTGGYAITATGVDAVEESEILLSDDRLLPGAESSVGQTDHRTD